MGVFRCKAGKLLNPIHIGLNCMGVNTIWKKWENIGPNANASHLILDNQALWVVYHCLTG